jgi:ecotin
VVEEERMRALSTAAVLTLLSPSPARAADDLQAFPPPGPGMVRHVLRLPKQADESAMSVQLVAGKTVRVDARNRYFFAGKIQPETIQGWGFVRYVVSELGPMAGTLMAVDPGEPKVDRFVSLGGEHFLVGYSSRVPLVVYAPEGVEVRWRIWTAAPEAKPMERG